MKASNKNNLRLVGYSAGSLAIFVLISAGLSLSGIRVNSTPSVPIGLWKIEDLNGRARRGQIVSVQPPHGGFFALAESRGYIGLGPCAGGVAPLLKPIAAVAGDCVTVSVQGIAVNGALLPNSNALQQDSMGRCLMPVKHGKYVVQLGTVWLVSGCARSFDSRYFGAVPTANILGTAKPIWIGGTIQ